MDSELAHRFRYSGTRAILDCSAKGRSTQIAAVYCSQIRQPTDGWHAGGDGG